jgi:hypothetical protein
VGEDENCNFVLITLFAFSLRIVSLLVLISPSRNINSMKVHLFTFYTNMLHPYLLLQSISAILYILAYEKAPFFALLTTCPKVVNQKVK